MAKPKTEVRMTQGTAVVLVLAVVAVLMFAFGAFEGSPEAPSPTGAVIGGSEQVPLQVIPAIEKTKLYASTYDLADFEGESQDNRVAGTMQFIKGGNLIETVTTNDTTSVSTTAEFNGGDIVSILADATGYYAAIVEDIAVGETLQSFKAYIKASATPTTEIWDEKGDVATTLTLTENDVSKVYEINIERPGDDNSYNFCGIAVDYDEDEVEVTVKDDTGSFNTGLQVLDDDFDYIDGEGYDAVWSFDEPIKNFDGIQKSFIIATAKDVTPATQNVTNENSADADVGITNPELIIAIN